MKRILVLLVLFIICVSMSFALDMTAVASNGKTVVLHDNGTWEYKGETNQEKYIGKWRFTDEMFDVILDEVLRESGIYSWSSEYAFYKAVMMDSIKAELGELSRLTMELKNDGTASLTIDGETQDAKFEVNSSTRLLYIIEDGEKTPFGVFSSDYTKLNIMGMEELFMSKIK